MHIHDAPFELAQKLSLQHPHEPSECHQINLRGAQCFDDFDDDNDFMGVGNVVDPKNTEEVILVNGTDHDSLKKGPGRDLRTYMPGEGQLIYIAGHRTTYLAPFSNIDSLRSGDRVTIEVPYGTFIYTVTRHRIVAATDLSVLRSPRHELVELQACHPRFFATHRYIAYARLVRVEPRGAAPFDVTAFAAQASGR